jgi:hypothetical protein
MKDYYTRQRRLWLANIQPHQLEDALYFAAAAALIIIAVCGLFNFII